MVAAMILFWCLSLYVASNPTPFLVAAAGTADPTQGFRQVQLKEGNFKLQKPYDVPLEKRYSFKDGIHKLWVYHDDKPFKPHSTTLPRTEIRIKGLDYSSGVWQFEGHAYVPKGSHGVTIFQIHGGRSISTLTLQLRVINDDLWYFWKKPIVSNIVEKWFRLNVIHDINKGKLYVMVNGELKIVGKDGGKGACYFKCGVYACRKGGSHYMESRWKNIKVFKK
ncbi:Citrate-binding protein [Linum grandiflorum]